MWQSLQVDEIAKTFPLAAVMGKGQNHVLLNSLRDFSIRKLPDEIMEILGPQDSLTPDENIDGDMQEVIPYADLGEESIPADREMEPFTLRDEEEDLNPTPQEIIDIDSIRKQAFQEGQSQANEAHSVQIAQMMQAHKKELEAVRQQTIQEMAVDLVQECERGFSTLQTSLEGDIAELIAPIIGAKMKSEALSEFVKEVANEAIASHLPMVIEGNQPLLDAFVKQAASHPQINLDHYHLKGGEHNELRLVAGNKILSTRFANLLRQLREII